MCDAPRVYNAEAVRSRIDRTCDECGRTIAAGEVHEYAFGVWDEPGSYRTCAACFEARAEMRSFLREFTDWYEEEIGCELAHGRLREAILTHCREVVGGPG